MKRALKIFGGVMLIVGTSLGGGMLALPVANADVGFPIASVLLTLCWLLMTFSAFLILEVSLAMPKGSNMISMAKTTLGRPGEAVAWVAYLLLLYSLLSAYISGGTDILHNVFELAGIQVPFMFSALIFVCLLGFIVYRGIQSVDYVNTGLMVAKLTVYVLLVFLIAPHVTLFKLEEWDIRPVLAPIMVLITSFGFAIIIPSLRNYFDDDVSALRTVVFIGSVIPLVAYLLWDGVIMGVIPHHGDGSLSAMLHDGHATVLLTKALKAQLNSPWITELFRFFTSISMLTAFLGVSLSLSDFLSDGFNLNKKGKQGLVVYVMTFIPPILIILFYPAIFIKALAYAGIFCVILLMLLPLLMAYGLRYHTELKGPYQVPCRKSVIVFASFISIILLVIGIIEQLK